MKKNAFTLIEVLVYIVILVIIFFVIISFLIWSLHSNIKVRSITETLNNANRIMEFMSHEIRESSSIYASTSVFDSPDGQLSLETTNHLPEGEQNTFIDFYLCGTRICFKEESKNEIPITPDSIEVSSLEFSRINTGAISSIQIDVTVNYKNPGSKPEYDSTANLKSTVSLRSY